MYPVLFINFQAVKREIKRERNWLLHLATIEAKQEFGHFYIKLLLV